MSASVDASELAAQQAAQQGQQQQVSGDEEMQAVVGALPVAYLQVRVGVSVLAPCVCAPPPVSLSWAAAGCNGDGTLEI